MIILMKTINGKGYISLCRYLIYKFSLRKEKRMLSARYKAHAFRLLSNNVDNYHLVKVGILIPHRLTFNPTFIAVYKQGNARQ